MRNRKSCHAALLIGAMFLCTGCSILNPSTLFMNEEERDAYYHSSPSFWDQTIAVDGSTVLSELQNDIFLGKPYNNILKFGDNILMIGEASYSSLLEGTFSNQEDVQYEFSFDVYSPWYNRITASLSHTETSCTSYQVCGDSLFLLDVNAMKLTRYDTSLTKTGEYNLSSFEDIDGLTFYPSGDSDTCFVTDAASEELTQLQFTGNSILRSPIDLPYYDLRVLYASPESHTITVFGISETSLQEKIARFDTKTLTVTEEYSAADTSDTVFGSGITFLPSGSSLLRRAELTDDTIPSSVTFSYYDAGGNGVAEFSYTFGDYVSQEDAEYLSQDAAFFEEESIGFFLIYNIDCQPYLLVWDYSTPTPGMEPLGLPDMGQSADDSADVGSSPDEDFGNGTADDSLTDGDASQGGASGSGTTDDSLTGSDAGSADSGIPDWGELAEVRERADELEQQHGIEIRFGQEVPSELGIYRLESCSDESLLSEALDTLSQSINCYPDGFFPQLCFGDTTGIIIYLSGTISGDTEGMLDSPTGFMDSDGHNLVMVLSTDYLWDWDYTISHEISHMIDQRLEYRAVYVEDSLFSEDAWASYNPEGCEYLNTYENYEENEQYPLYADYFADAYGMTFPTEDRAELFGLAMSDYLGSFDEDVFFKANAPTTEKYRYYCACIRDGFDTTGWAEVMPWEKIIQN
jgi:hypothetical protein